MLYYTNSLKPLEEQNQPSRSVGGFISTSPVGNDLFGAVFSEISKLDEEELTPETVCLAFKNEQDVPIYNIKFTFYLDDNAISNLSVGFEAASVDDCSNKFFESIPNTRSKPIQTTLSAVTDGITFEVAELASGDYLGVWLRREIDSGAVTPKSCDQLYEDYQNDVSPETTEEISLEIDWSEDQSVSDSVSASLSVSAS